MVSADDAFEEMEIDPEQIKFIEEAGDKQVVYISNEGQSEDGSGLMLLAVAPDYQMETKPEMKEDDVTQTTE